MLVGDSYARERVQAVPVAQWLGFHTAEMVQVETIGPHLETAASLVQSFVVQGTPHLTLRLLFPCHYQTGCHHHWDASAPKVVLLFHHTREAKEKVHEVVVESVSLKACLGTLFGVVRANHALVDHHDCKPMVDSLILVSCSHHYNWVKQQAVSSKAKVVAEVVVLARQGLAQAHCQRQGVAELG